MAIIQYDPVHPNQAIGIDPDNPARLTVQSFAFAGKNTAAGAFDLTPYQGGPFRLYIESDGSYSTDFYSQHYWLLCEVVLPPARYVSQQTDDPMGGGMLMPVPLDLRDVDINVYPLP